MNKLTILTVFWFKSHLICPMLKDANLCRISGFGFNMARSILWSRRSLAEISLPENWMQRRISQMFHVKTTVDYDSIIRWDTMLWIYVLCIDHVPDKSIYCIDINLCKLSLFLMDSTGCGHHQFKWLNNNAHHLFYQMTIIKKIHFIMKYQNQF